MSRTRPTENTSYVYCGLKLFALSFLPLARSSSPGSQPGQGSGLDCQSQATGRISDQDPCPGHSETATQAPNTSVLCRQKLGRTVQHTALFNCQAQAPYP